MGQIALIFVSVISGVVLAMASNWLYDIFKAKGIFPERPTLKRFIVIVLGFIPFVFLVALPLILPMIARNSATIPPLAVNLVNTSKSDITIDARADFELLVGARISLGTTVASGSMDLIPLDGKKQEFLVIPAESQIPVFGFFSDPESLLPFLEKGDSDILLRIYRTGGGVIFSETPFRFYKDWLEKYRLDIDVSK